MRFLVATVTALVLLGCSPSRLPTSPDPATPTPAPPSSAATDGWIWAMAVGKSGRCIEGATFEVVSGQGALGAVITQQTPCGVWDYEGGVMFKDLTPTIPMTLRASAAGYKTTEQSIRPNVRSGQAATFLLEELP